MLLRDHHVNSIEQIIVLLALYDANRSGKAIKLSDLHALSTQSKSSFFRMIKKLEDEQGWIKTDTNFDDQRSKWIHLTDEAVQMMEEINESNIRNVNSSQQNIA
jgi:DNA-binding MarR family transcriptional regulator